jgi:hypothetical protein
MNARKPPLGVLRSPVERAELARGDADVGVVDVAVDQVRDDAVGVAAAPHRVGGLAQGVEGRVGVEQQRLGGRDPATVRTTLQDVVDSPVRRHDSKPTQPRPSPSPPILELWLPIRGVAPDSFQPQLQGRREVWGRRPRLR